MCATSTVNNKAFLDKCDLQIMEGCSRSQVSGKEIYHISPEAQLNVTKLWDGSIDRHLVVPNLAASFGKGKLIKLFIWLLLLDKCNFWLISPGGFTSLHWARSSGLTLKMICQMDNYCDYWRKLNTWLSKSCAAHIHPQVARCLRWPFKPCIRLGDHQ